MAQEQLSGGLVTARDPSLLAPGELQQTDDFFYKPSSPSLHKVLGKTRYNSTALGTPIGLQFCGFDLTDDLLIAAANTRLYKSIVGSGTFSILAENASGPTLEAIHYNNRHVLLTGATTNKVLLSDGTARPHGMQPVTSPPGLTLTNPGGTWPLTGQFGWFEYWTTEVYKVGTEDIESTFVGTPSQVNVTANTNYVTIVRPGAILGNNATHWRVYRSIKKDTPGIVAFPNGFQIGEIPIATSSFNDGLSVNTGPNLATTGDNLTSAIGYQPYTTTKTIAGNWTNPGNVTADDGSNAVSGTVFLNAGAENDPSPMRAGSFGLGAVGNPITDITVTVEAKKNGTAGALSAALSWDGGIHWTTDRPFPSLTGAIAAVSVSGGKWGREWSATEFVDGTFFVRLTAYSAINGATDTVEVDYCKVTVANGGTTATQSIAFRDIQISLGGVATRIGAAGPPPVSTTGDIFQDSLVLNDVTNPTQVMYSMPGDIDAFPAVYLLRTDTKDKDIVTNIKSLGSVCLVGLASQVWRVNYLPREEDAEFDRGRCIEVVDTDHGMAGTHAACKFTLNGQTMVGYVSSSGLRMTNGFQAMTMTDDLDWDVLTLGANLSQSILVNDARYNQLRFYYKPGLCLFLSYHPSHLKDGKLKVSGPAHVNTISAASGITQLQKSLYSLGSDGYVYTENRGSVDDSGAGVAPVLRTREMYLANPGSEWNLQDISIHHQSSGGGTYQVSYEVAKTNTNVRSTQSKPFTTIRRGLSNISAFEAGEGIAVKIAGTDDSLPSSFDYIVLNGQNMGSADPLTR